MHAIHHRQHNPCRGDSSYIHPLEVAIGLGLYVATIYVLSWFMGNFHVVTVIFTFIAAWNEFVIAFTLTSTPDVQPLTVGLIISLAGGLGSLPGTGIAAGLIGLAEDGQRESPRPPGSTRRRRLAAGGTPDCASGELLRRRMRTARWRIVPA